MKKIGELFSFIVIYIIVVSVGVMLDICCTVLFDTEMLSINEIITIAGIMLVINFIFWKSMGK